MNPIESTSDHTPSRRRFLRTLAGFGAVATTLPGLTRAAVLPARAAGARYMGDFAAPYGSGHINDTDFKVHRDGHNLDRCRTQFKLLESLKEQQAAMRQLVASLGA